MHKRTEYYATMRLKVVVNKESFTQEGFLSQEQEEETIRDVACCLAKSHFNSFSNPNRITVVEQESKKEGKIEKYTIVT